MTLDQARILQRFWKSAPEGDALELGFAYGKGSAYLGAIASQLGRRVTCIDNLTAHDRNPLAEETVRLAGVADNVDLVFAENGYLWWMKQQLEAQVDCRKFSLIYLDGAHDWFVDGFATLLLDRFIVAGGVLILDDLNWTMASSNAPDIVARRAALTEDLVNTQQIRSVWELLLQRDRTWGEFEEIGDWGIARKLSAADLRPSVERVVVRPTLHDVVSAVARRFRRGDARTGTHDWNG
ncbi:MAG TPA: class I SAM-dependent methyltransferase [Acidimicrobiales bacterium]